MICKKCKKEMALEDVNYPEPLSKENDYICKCGMTCIVTTLFNGESFTTWCDTDQQLTE